MWSPHQENDLVHDLLYKRTESLPLRHRTVFGSKYSVFSLQRNIRVFRPWVCNCMSFRVSDGPEDVYKCELIDRFPLITPREDAVLDMFVCLFFSFSPSARCITDFSTNWTGETAGHRPDRVCSPGLWSHSHDGRTASDFSFIITKSSWWSCASSDSPIMHTFIKLYTLELDAILSVCRTSLLVYNESGEPFCEQNTRRPP